MNTCAIHLCEFSLPIAKTNKRPPKYFCSVGGNSIERRARAKRGGREGGVWNYLELSSSSFTFPRISVSWFVAGTVCNVSFFLVFRFIRVGGYKLLNAWLTYAKSTTNTPLLQLILLTLQKLPLKVDHLKQVEHSPSPTHALCIQAGPL